MRFCDFLNILHDNTSYTLSQSQFILELFSALCGETDPSAKNTKSSFSNALPEGLKGNDSGYRNRLYNGNHPKYKGLSHLIKKHIRKNNNKDTFIAYLDDVYKNNMANLCTAFGVSKAIDKTKIFEMIYKQFMDYATNDNDDATFKLKNVSPKDDRPFEEVFNDAVREFDIEGFLESNPTESLLPHFFDDMIAFNGIIQRSYKDKNTLHKDENTSYKMNEFSEILLKYVKYLNKRMKPISTKKVKSLNYTRVNASYVKYEPPKDNKNFGRYSLKYRNNLKSLYDEIQTLQQK